MHFGSEITLATSAEGSRLSIKVAKLCKNLILSLMKQLIFRMLRNVCQSVFQGERIPLSAANGQEWSYPASTSSRDAAE